MKPTSLPVRLLGLVAAVPLLAPALAAQAIVTDATKLELPGGAAFDSFGRQVLLDGDQLIVTANAVDAMGAAYAYRLVGGVWTQEQKFRGSDTAQADNFGFAAARDGDLLVVGAHRNSALVPNGGAAYVFERQGGAWVELQKLSAPNPADFDSVGWSVAIGGDLVVLGAIGDDQLGASAGAAYVFRRSGGAWGFEQKLLASTGDAVDEFGWQVATDGTLVVVTAVSDEQGPAETGAVFVFEHNGTSWQETQRLVPADAAHDDWFGWDIALQGSTIVASAINHDLPIQEGGAVYAYTKTGNGWSLAQKLTPSNLGPGHSIGWSLALDGTNLAAAAADDGAVYLYHHDGTQWVEVLECEAPGQFGGSCDLDGDTLVGGDPWAGGLKGAAFVFPINDLGLDAKPDSVPAGGPLTLETYGGLAGAPVGLLTLSVGGTPILRRFGAGTFDANGKYVHTFVPPPSFSGKDVLFGAMGFWSNGLLGFSNVVTVSFQ